MYHGIDQLHSQRLIDNLMAVETGKQIVHVFKRGGSQRRYVFQDELIICGDSNLQIEGLTGMSAEQHVLEGQLNQQDAFGLVLDLRRQNCEFASIVNDPSQVLETVV